MSANAVPCQEPRPRDFSARLSRAQPLRLAGARPRMHPARHALVALAAIAVPAVAAPDEWARFEIGDAGRAEIPIQPMPFETAGASFPGSAFYYLTHEAPASPGLGEGIRSDAEDAPAGIPEPAGPAARALRIDNSGIDRTRALQCLTAAIYYEAASEPDAGQRAVAQVVLNRVAHPSYPNTVCGVVYQGSERTTGCQFSFTCDGALARAPSRMFWLRAESVARAALSGEVYAPVGLATHYHTVQIHPYWADSLKYLGTIGAHRFYRFGGPAGQPAAFRFAYLGGEPIAAPHRRSAAADAAPDPVLDPAAVQRAWEAGLKTAQGGAVAPTQAGLAPVRTAPAPAYSAELQSRGGEALYSGDRLPQATGIRPEFERSGQWITQPGT
jgi:hypothetical protein